MEVKRIATVGVIYIFIFVVCLCVPLCQAETNINFYFADLLKGTGSNNSGSDSGSGSNPNLCTINCTREEILKNKTRFLYDAALYPNNLAILADQNDTILNGVYAPGVKGRFDPIGTFGSFREMKEYFYALGATPAAHAIAMHYVSLFASGNEVYLRVNIEFEFYNVTVNPPTAYRRSNITMVARLLFNEANLLVSLDGIIHNLAGLLDPRTAQQQQDQILQTCYAIVVNPGNCNQTTDPNGYFSSLEECIGFMNSIPYGSYANAATPTVTCRVLHTTLTIFDPVLHCPHVGKTGGGKCIEFSYDSFYDEQF